MCSSRGGWGVRWSTLKVIAISVLLTVGFCIACFVSLFAGSRHFLHDGMDEYRAAVPECVCNDPVLVPQFVPDCSCNCEVADNPPAESSRSCARIVTEKCVAAGGYGLLLKADCYPSDFGVTHNVAMKIPHWWKDGKLFQQGFSAIQREAELQAFLWSEATANSDLRRHVLLARNIELLTLDEVKEVGTQDGCSMKSNVPILDTLPSSTRVTSIISDYYDNLLSLSDIINAKSHTLFATPTELRKMHPMPVFFMYDLFLGVAKGLRALHGLQILHKDIAQPGSNILVTEDHVGYTAVLFDLGVSMRCEDLAHAQNVFYLKKMEMYLFGNMLHVACHRKSVWIHGGLAGTGPLACDATTKIKKKMKKLSRFHVLNHQTEGKEGHKLAKETRYDDEEDSDISKLYVTEQELFKLHDNLLETSFCESEELVNLMMELWRPCLFDPDDPALEWDTVIETLERLKAQGKEFYE
eukprot:Rmarinus@m.10322